MATVLPAPYESNFREVLRAEFSRRMTENARYSLRKYAADLQLSPSRMSEVLSGKQGMSSRVAEVIAERIGLDGDRKRHFCDLVESEHSRSAAGRLAAEKRVRDRDVDHEFRTIESDSFKTISDWYHYAIFQIIECRVLKLDATSIARHLGIHRQQAMDGIDRLIRLEILSRDSRGRLITVRPLIATTDGVPSTAIRAFHKQILEKALVAIEAQSIERRNYSANVISIDRSKLPAAKEMMMRFRRRFMQEISAGHSKTAVYCLSMQFFELTEMSD